LEQSLAPLLAGQLPALVYVYGEAGVGKVA
jgi:Cdc6-like AAA superfamily ATPase